MKKTVLKKIGKKVGYYILMALILAAAIVFFNIPGSIDAADGMIPR